MAKPKSTAKGKTKGKSDSAKPANRLLILVTFMAMVPFSLPTLMVMTAALLPTLGAALTERSGSRYAWVCVGGMNFSGLAPWLFDLWFGHHTIDYALHQITGVSMLLISYGAAGVGWLIYLAVPPIVSAITGMTSQRQSLVLASQQKKLIELWGEGIARGGEL